MYKRMHFEKKNPFVIVKTQSLIATTMTAKPFDKY